MADRHERDQGIGREPHLRPDGASARDGEATRRTEAHAEARLAREAARRPDHDHSVFDEPGGIFGADSPAGRRGPIEQDWTCEHCGYNLRGHEVLAACPECGRVSWTQPGPHARGRYAQRMREDRARPRPSWYLPSAFAAGAALAIVFGVACAVVSRLPGGLSIVVLPVVAEVAKVAVVLLTIEKRPALLRRESELRAIVLTTALLVALVEGVSGAAILGMTIPAGGPIDLWRVVLPFVVAAVVQVGCALWPLPALVRAWRDAVDEGRRPRMDPVYRRLFEAAGAHAVIRAAVFLLLLVAR
ncbi:MAG: hypothetical protein KF817_05930 [Phycisphaeraceae bacterium]|nr:hypothetical protein [Phycisphaeraceae bacterium]